MGRKSRDKQQRREAGLVLEKKSFHYQTGLEKTCLFIITLGIYVALFVPLIVLPQFFFPFVAPKTIIFLMIVQIILIPYLFLLFSNPHKYRPRINLLTVTLSIFLAIFILTSFTGINFEKSFWSTYERMTGAWTLLHLFAFFIILSSVFKKREDWERILGVAVIVGVLLSLHVLMGDEPSPRGGGTIGNTSFMGAYLLFPIFFAIILLLTKRGPWQIFSGISLLIMIPVLLTSTARGAIVAFCFGIFLLILGYFLFSGNKILKKTAYGTVFLLLILAISAAVFQPVFIENFVKDVLREMQPRFVVWEKAWQGFLERPILGWGPENFNVVFLKYFNPCMFLPECGGEIWFDRAHNIVLDTLINSGILGLLSYLAIFLVAILGLLKVLPKITDKRNLFLPLGLAILLVIYFFQNLLVFDMINSYLMFFLSLGFIHFLISPREESQVKTKPLPFYLIIPVIIFIIFIFWLGSFQPLQANYFLIKTLQAQNIEEIEKFFQKSLDSWMNKYEAREQFAQRMIWAVNQETPQENKQAFQRLFQLAETEMEKSIRENSLDFRPHLFLGQLYIASYRLSENPEKLKKAEKVLEKAKNLSPTNQQVYWNLAELKLIQQKPKEAINFLQKAIDLEPRLERSHQYLIRLYQLMEQEQK